LSQPTAGKIADDLLLAGMIEECDPEPQNESARELPPKLGRPARMLRLNRTDPRFVGIQLGIHETGFAALPVGVDPGDRWMLQLPTPATADAWGRQLRRAAKELKVPKPWAVMVSVPGIVDEAAGVVLFSPNLHWTEAANLKELVREVWPGPVLLVQEERALALGHQYLDPECDDFLLVDFGDGVGAAVVVAGRLSANPLPISGELGHNPVMGNTRPCGCGATGCLETLASTRGLLRSFAEAHPSAAPDWAALKRCVEKSGIEPWLAETLDATAVGIAGALNVIGLRHVVLTGALPELSPLVVEHLSTAIERGAMWARFGRVEVEAAPRRRTAGLVAVGIDRFVHPMTSRRTRRLS
jgi:predicted NBD/HSP70 family sugar kinase